MWNAFPLKKTTSTEKCNEIVCCIHPIQAHFPSSSDYCSNQKWESSQGHLIGLPAEQSFSEPIVFYLIPLAFNNN